MSEPMATKNVHLSDASSLETDETGFYTARCECGWAFGPLPDVETVVDALMDHARDIEAATIRGAE